MYLVGVDVGGTHTKFGLIENDKIIKSIVVETNAFDVLRQVSNGIRELVQNSGKYLDQITGVAVGFPGMVVGSMVKDSPNIGIKECNVEKILSEELGCPVIVKNDAELATLAEHKMGAGDNCNSMVLLTFGTGIGGGIIANGKLYDGVGGAGEFGHVSFERNGKRCTCGRIGCAEQYLSMAALEKLAREIIAGHNDTIITETSQGRINASELVRAYKKNDACAVAIITKYVAMLTEYILDICNLFRPEKIVIGGGITYAPEIIDMVAKKCKEQNFGFANSPRVDIVPAKLGNNAGMLGAVACYENFKQDEITKPLSQYDVNLEEDEIEETADTNAEIEKISQSVDLLNQFVQASKASSDDDEIVYDDSLLARVNEMLKKKNR